MSSKLYIMEIISVSTSVNRQKDAKNPRESGGSRG